MVESDSIGALSKTILSDRGPQFISRNWIEELKKREIKVKLTSSYHPKSDGITERAIQTLLQYLRILSYQDKEDWINWISQAVILMNRHVNKTIKFIPKQAAFLRTRATAIHPEVNLNIS